MSTTRVREYLKQFEKDGQVQEFDASNTTVELAAEVLGVEPARIAKAILLKDENGCILIVTVGDGKIDNSTFKCYFGMKTRVLVPEETEELTGYRVGGIRPFDNPEGTKVHLDESLRRLQTVSPACGTSNLAIELTCDELLECSRAQGRADVYKGQREQSAEG